METTKSGWLWVDEVRSNRVLSHIAQDMVYFWFGAIGSECAQIPGSLGAFWGQFADILWS